MIFLRLLFASATNLVSCFEVQALIHSWQVIDFYLVSWLNHHSNYTCNQLSLANYFIGKQTFEYLAAQEKELHTTIVRLHQHLMHYSGTFPFVNFTANLQYTGSRGGRT